MTAIFGDRLTLHHSVGLDKPVDVLIEQARVALQKLGHQLTMLDVAYDFDVDSDHLRHVAAQPESFDRYRDVTSIPSPLRFYYRQSPQYLVPWMLSWKASMSDPPLNVPGMATLILDPQGRLLYLAVVPPEQDSAGPSPASSNWDALLGLAGLSPSALTPAVPAWTPPVYADARMAWTWSTGGATPISLRAEAAAYRGRPVYFELIGPWRQPTIPPTAVAGPGRGLAIAGVVVFVVILIGSALLARRNIRLGRGDRDGAFRLAAVSFGLSAASFVVGANHVAGANEELELFVRALAILLLRSLHSRCTRRREASRSRGGGSWRTETRDSGLGARDARVWMKLARLAAIVAFLLAGHAALGGLWALINVPESNIPPHLGWALMLRTASRA